MCLRIAVAVPVVAMGLDSIVVWYQSKSAISTAWGKVRSVSITIRSFEL